MAGKAIFLFNLTRIMVDPWLKGGYECWMYDGQHPDGIHRDPEEPNLVRVGRMFDADNTEAEALRIAEEVGPGVMFVASFAECTDLTCTGARWWEAKRKKDPRFQEKAVALAKMVEQVAIFAAYESGGYDDKEAIPWMLENPKISRLSTMWRPCDHWFHPYHFGGYLPEDHQHSLYPEIYPARDSYPKQTGIWCGGAFNMPDHKPVPAVANNPGWAKLGGSSTRTKNIRSATPEGFALAVYQANVPF
ncbi:DNA methyltransferase [Escherichia phage Sortsne]|uniref:Dcm methylase n=1 Tax=Escherichia phage Sortsne TaxID=2562456 RepID=A0A4D6DZ13_9CAUD|nr:DNA methyltransferase [Escherichia phage Sortsne]QBZ71581.1 Dcm methylase [Escherichia phage Sortsne]